MCSTQNFESISPPKCATCPTHLILFDLTILMHDEDYKLRSTSLWNILHFLVTSTLLDLHVLLSTLFSNTVNRYSSLTMRTQVSQL
jgi:hypothetical protein